MVEHMTCLKVNVPHFFRDRSFRKWLNAGARKEIRRMSNDAFKAENLATWHRAGEKAGEFSDVFVTFDSGDGSDAPSNGKGYPSGEGMPAKFWDELCVIARRELGSHPYCVLWLTNIDS